MNGLLKYADMRSAPHVAKSRVPIPGDEYADAAPMTDDPNMAPVVEFDCVTPERRELDCNSGDTCNERVSGASVLATPAPRLYATRGRTIGEMREMSRACRSLASTSLSGWGVGFEFESVEEASDDSADGVVSKPRDRCRLVCAGERNSTGVDD